MPCPHGVEYYNECETCNTAHFTKALEEASRANGTDATTGSESSSFNSPAGREREESPASQLETERRERASLASAYLMSQAMVAQSDANLTETEAELARVKSDRDSWRRVAERLEREKLAAYTALATEKEAREKAEKDDRYARRRRKHA
jgi:hypothetical protein